MKLKLIATAIAAALATHVSAQNLEAQQIATALKQSAVTLAWDRGITGRTAYVGVIDSGFDLSHSDIRYKIDSSRNFYQPGAVTWGLHGTQMASIAAGARNGTGTVGVAPDAQLILAQIGSGGTSAVLSDRALEASLGWMSTTRATVVNLSLGADYSDHFVNTALRTSQSGVFIASPAYGVNYGQSPTAINYYKLVTDKNMVLVASAGNQGLAYSEFPGMFATRVDSNGGLVLGGKMLVVGAVDAKNTITNFSNRAAHLCQNYAGTRCTDIYLTRDFFVVAPGVNVYSAQPNQIQSGNGATPVTGTSPAAAYVSGGIALMRQAWPQLRAEQLVRLVLDTAKDLGPRGIDDTYGAGLVDFDAATRPRGNLVVASPQYKLNGSVMPGTMLLRSQAALSGTFAVRLRSTSVLQNTQVIDEIGRNYRADMTSAISTKSLMTFAPESPWLGISGYRTALMPVANDLDLKIMYSTTGTAAETRFRQNKGIYTMQLGSMQEGSGFLGNYGAGAMSLGSSSTAWMQVGYEHTIANGVRALANYGQGITSIAADPNSLVRVSDRVSTSSWRLGLEFSELNVGDRINVSIAQPVSIRQGHADVTAVTGYSYTDLPDGTVEASPIVERQRVNLRNQINEYNLAVNYVRAWSRNAYATANIIQRFNAGGQPGHHDTFIGANIVWIQ